MGEDCEDNHTLDVLVLTVLYVVSGLGITHYSVVEQLTLGILTKSLSLRIHDNLLIPFLILLFLHVLLRLR